MIPISLDIQGLYSYQEHQHIDFTKLTNAGLFGIFGSVGSGKSSILEAITYALYGKIDRLNEKGDNRNYNMMNLKSHELLIDFVFEAGQNADQYRFVVKGKRNRKNFDQVNTFERKGYQWQDNQWLPLESADAENILGLSYENFKRTIIIPQGKFQEFLQLSETERTRMLRQIFNLERFELSQKVAVVEKQNNQELNRLEGELKGLEAVTEEAKTEKQQAYQAKQEEKENLDQSYQQAKNRFDQLTNLKQLHEQHKEAKQTFESLKQQKAEMDEREQKLTQYEQCRYYFADKIERANSLDKDIEERQGQIKQNKDDLAEKDKTIIRIKGELHQIREIFPEQKNLEAAIADLKSLIQIREFEAQKQQKTEKLQQAKQAYEKLSGQLEQQKTEKQNLREQIEKQKQEKQDQGTLGAIKNWFTQKNHHLTNLKRLEDDIEQANEQINKLKAQRKQIIQTQKLDQLNEEFSEYSLKALRPELENLKQNYREQIQTIETALLHYQTRQQLEHYASELEEGSPCPVCGATEHPDKLEAGDAAAKIKSLQAQKTDYQNWIEAIQQGLQDLEGLKSQYQSLKKQLDQGQKDKEQEQEALNKHQQAFQWPDYQQITEEEVDKLLKQAQTQSQELEKLETQLKEQETALESTQKNLQEADQNLKTLEQEVNSLQERISAYQQQLQRLNFQDYQDREKETLNNQLKDWEQKLEEFQNLETALENRQNEYKELNQTLRHKQEQLNEKQNERKELGDQLQHLLEQSAFDNLGDIAKILDQSIDVDTEKKTIQAFRDQYHQQQGILKNLEDQLADKETFQPEEYENVRNNLEQVEKQLENVNNALAVLDQQIQDLNKKLENKQKLQQQHQAYETRAENIKTLKSLFQASGFVKYVSSVFLKDLCRSANERFFRLTRQQLRLEVTEDNNFLVRDFLNNGQLRHIKTLSGGQTFQASLSLALALAENIQRLTQSAQNFFFLDEGFGSQDQESLNIVFETLKSLRKENRIVGVISHVEALKEEIDMALTIENDPDRGSLVKESWEG